MVAYGKCKCGLTPDRPLRFTNHRPGRQGNAKSPSFREQDVTHLCVVLYLHAAHEFNLISTPLTGYRMETKRRKQFLGRNVLVND